MAVAKFPLHTKCRNATYLGGPERAHVDDSNVPWTSRFDDYSPFEYLAPSVAAQPVWADDRKKLAAMMFNKIDGNVSRVSYEGTYALDPKSGMPLNPRGRTGICERGLLGRYGPNHAADPVVTRWKRDAKGKIMFSADHKPMVEFVAIKRKDTGEWGFPGGMVEPGATVNRTLLAEFGEEAMNSLEMTPEEHRDMEQKLGEFFKNGTVVYQGYVDDPRNTDNAWMETVAMHFHDEKGDVVGRFNLKSGDDAGEVAWTTITADLKLYASHAVFLHQAWKNLLDSYAAAHPKGASVTTL